MRKKQKNVKPEKHMDMDIFLWRLKKSKDKSLLLDWASLAAVSETMWGDHVFAAARI